MVAKTNRYVMARMFTLKDRIVQDTRGPTITAIGMLMLSESAATKANHSAGTVRTTQNVYATVSVMDAEIARPARVRTNSPKGT